MKPTPRPTPRDPGHQVVHAAPSSVKTSDDVFQKRWRPGSGQEEGQRATAVPRGPAEAPTPAPPAKAASSKGAGRAPDAKPRVRVSVLLAHGGRAPGSGPGPGERAHCGPASFG